MELARSSSLIRATIFVLDLERATSFYHTLGLNEVYYEGVLEDPSACSILGFSISKPYPVRILKRPGPNYGMVGLFELSPELEPASILRASGPARRGEVALVFYVRSMSETLAALRGGGATWSPEPELFVMGHRQQAEVCLRDCDGVLINLVETNPDEQEETHSELSVSLRRGA